MTQKLKLIKYVTTLCFAMGMFFNPFGFDVLFKKVMDLTGSYWVTDLIFYCLSGLWFGFYLLLTRWQNRIYVTQDNSDIQQKI